MTGRAGRGAAAPDGADVGRGSKTRASNGSVQRERPAKQQARDPLACELRRLRESAGLSGYALATRAHVDRGHLHRIESSTRPVSGDVLARLVGVLAPAQRPPIDVAVLCDRLVTLAGPELLRQPRRAARAGRLRPGGRDRRAEDAVATGVVPELYLAELARQRRALHRQWEQVHGVLWSEGAAASVAAAMATRSAELSDALAAAIAAVFPSGPRQ